MENRQEAERLGQQMVHVNYLPAPSYERLRDRLPELKMEDISEEEPHLLVRSILTPRRRCQPDGIYWARANRADIDPETTEVDRANFPIIATLTLCERYLGRSDHVM
jgi:hypothetical protein